MNQPRPPFEPKPNGPAGSQPVWAPNGGGPTSASPGTPPPAVQGGPPTPDDINGPTVQLTPAQLGRAVPPPAQPGPPPPPLPRAAGPGGWTAPPAGPDDINGPTVQLTPAQLARAGSPSKKPWVKWALIGGATVLVVIVTVAAVVLIGGHAGPTGPGRAPTPAVASDYASANDNAAATIITKDPSCAPLTPITNTVLDVVKKSGWLDVDPAIPATAWTPEQRQSYVTATQAMRTGADQLVPLTKATTHRVLREIYQQAIVYSRAYADSVPNYTEADRYLSNTRAAFMDMAYYLCQAVTTSAAASRAPFIKAPNPSTVSSVSDPKTLEAFMTNPDPACGQWLTAWRTFISDSAVQPWVKLDGSIGAGSWTPEQREATEAIVAPLNHMADIFEQVANKTDNVILRDFGQLAAQYARAYVQALPTYTSVDDHLYQTVKYTALAVMDVCTKKAN